MQHICDAIIDEEFAVLQFTPPPRLREERSDVAIQMPALADLRTFQGQYVWIATLRSQRRGF
jgi:hypothetical protein